MFKLFVFVSEIEIDRDKPLDKLDSDDLSQMLVESIGQQNCQNKFCNSSLQIIRMDTSMD